MIKLMRANGRVRSSADPLYLDPDWIEAVYQDGGKTAIQMRSGTIHHVWDSPEDVHVLTTRHGPCR